MHHMLEEIASEPEVVKRFTSRDFPDIENITRVLSKSEVVYAIGNGTSYHAAVFTSILLNRAGIDCVPIYSSQTDEWISSRRNRSASIIFSQSGGGADILKSVEDLKRTGSTIIAVTNIEGSRLDSASDLKILTEAGTELAIPATKTHLSQLLVSIRLALANDRETYNSRLDAIEKNFVKILSKKEAVKDLAEHHDKGTIFLGSGLLYPIALEASLKLMEASDLLSYAFPVREFLHGPKQILNENWSVFFLSEDRAVMEEVNRYTRRVVDVSEYLREGFGITMDEEMTRSVTILFFAQMFSYYSAVKRGLNPDSPSKLSKVVT